MKPKKSLAEGQEAPDPLEYAAQQSIQDAPPDVGDPTIPAVSAEPTMASAFAMIAQALQSIKSGENGAAERLASIERFLMNQESVRPHENLFAPPMISNYNPLGERDNPRPDLRCKVIWVGYELTKDGLNRTEIDLLNRVKPGAYRVQKADGRIIQFTVSEKLNDAGEAEKLIIHFPTKGDERNNHRPMSEYLQMCLGEHTSREDLLSQISKLKAQLGA